MPSITSSQLRSKYLDFFVGRGHAAIPSASLVPASDPTVLFTTAGMHPLVPYLLGEPHPAGTRLVSCQKCVRTGDIDVVGDDSHLTWFEMLGNWSLGDYGRDDSIAWSFEFLTRELGLPLDRLGATCFAGDDQVRTERSPSPALPGEDKRSEGRTESNDLVLALEQGQHRVPEDRASVAIWRRLGMPAARIALLGRDDNWWGPTGDTGPCGPDTEIFFWVGEPPAPEALDVRDRRWVEIWNNVFMSYTRTAAGDIVPLARGNVDTGMGVERTLVALNGLRSVYEIDTIAPLLDELRGLAGTERSPEHRAPARGSGSSEARDRRNTIGDGGCMKYSLRPAVAHERELRVLADHVRAACFVIADGVRPGNKDRGHVLRRLIRRSIVFARRLGLPARWIARAVAVVPRMLGDAYPEIARDPGAIAAAITGEASRFERALAHGLRMLDRRGALDGEAAFDLQQTYGLPFEITRELAQAAGKHIDEDDFRRALEAHRERSRAVPIGRSRR